jgi:hypothetical protein
MGEIQNFSEEHATAVAALFFKAMRGQAKSPGRRLPEYLCELLLHNPWASLGIPSLVYLEKGKVVGSLGVVPRPMEFRGTPISVATVTQFMVDPDYRRGPAAVQLLRSLFQGPQDMTWTDGAGEEVNGLWTALGGFTAPLYAFNWIRILRPFGTARIGLDRAGRTGARLKGATGLLTAPADFLLSKLPLSILREPDSPFRSKLVSPEELLECIQEIGWREPLKPAYSPPSFSWLMSEAGKVQNCDLRMLTVTNPAGLLCGWFVYYAQRGGASYVLQIGVRRRDHFENTLRALFRDAWQQGSACVKGQSIPKYLTSLTAQNCFFRHPNSATLVHSRNPDITNAVRCGDAALTRLDGECWLRFTPEPWT